MKDFLLNLFFPKFCLNCKKEGFFLCYDCFSLIEILNKTYCPFCHPAKLGKTCFVCSEEKSLNGLYTAVPCSDFIVKKIISQFQNNYLKELSFSIASILTTHLYLCNVVINNNIVLTFIPCSLKEKKKKGYDPAEEITKELSGLIKIPINDNIVGKTVFIIDLSFEEKLDNQAKKLKQQGAKKVFGLTLTRD